MGVKIEVVKQIRSVHYSDVYTSVANMLKDYIAILASERKPDDTEELLERVNVPSEFAQTCVARQLDKTALKHLITDPEFQHLVGLQTTEVQFLKSIQTGINFMLRPPNLSHSWSPTKSKTLRRH